MNIAVVHNLAEGGARRRLANQMRHLPHAIVEICLETSAPITEDPVVVPLRQMSPDHPRVLRPPLRYLDVVALYAAWRRAAARVRGSGVDVVYLNPCRFLQAPPVLNGSHPPVVYFCDETRRVDHEPEAAASRNARTMPLYRPLYVIERQLDMHTTRSVDIVATNSRYSACEIRRTYGRRAEVLTMGVANSLRSAETRPVSGSFLLSVGTLIPGKGHDLAIGAAAVSVSKPSVRIVAPRPDPAEEARLRRVASRYRVELTVQVGIPDDELASLYSSALATLYLAMREPFGLVSIEAQARGCPVIVSDQGGLPETILPDRTGWSVVREPGAVAARVDRLSDPALRAKMSAAAREHAASWTWEASADQVEQLLDRARRR